MVFTFDTVVRQGITALKKKLKEVAESYVLKTSIYGLR